MFAYAVGLKDLMDPVDTVGLAVHPVEAILIAYVEADEQETGDTDREPEHIEKRIALLADHITFENLEIVAVHHKIGGISRPFDIGPPEKPQHIPYKKETRDLTPLIFQGTVIQLIGISLYLLQKRRITIPLQKAVSPFRWRSVGHNSLYKRESNEYVSSL
jgi:hypothetical protein